MAQLSYQYRLYPTPTQERVLDALMYQCKRLWNLVHDKHNWTRQTRQRGASLKEQYEAFKLEVTGLGDSWRVLKPGCLFIMVFASYVTGLGDSWRVLKRFTLV